jgi:hypothetical protein
MPVYGDLFLIQSKRFASMSDLPWQQLTARAAENRYGAGLVKKNIWSSPKYLLAQEASTNIREYSHNSHFRATSEPLTFGYALANIPCHSGADILHDGRLATYLTTVLCPLYGILTAVVVSTTSTSGPGGQ